tara:strand:+ start:32 stop:1096 length:1065 start_codon:yes stop_codon:yes gene_type:complete
MKYAFIFSLIFVIASCSKSVSSDKLVFRDSLVFEINEQQPFSGTSVSYHPNGQIKEKINYIDGKLGLFQESYFDNGQIKEKVNYIDGKLRLIHVYESYFDNGQTKFIKNYDKQGKRNDGKSFRYFKNGSIEEETTFENGRLNGSYLYFEQVGTSTRLIYKENYKDGSRHGIREEFRDGVIWRTTEYDNGRIVDGIYESLTPSNKLRVREKYESGLVYREEYKQVDEKNCLVEIQHYDPKSQSKYNEIKNIKYKPDSCSLDKEKIINFISDNSNFNIGRSTIEYKGGEIFEVKCSRKKTISKDALVTARRYYESTQSLESSRFLRFWREEFSTADFKTAISVKEEEIESGEWCIN